MTIATQSDQVTSTNRMISYSWLAQILMMTARSLRTLIRKPETFVPGIFTSVFFLLIFNGALGSSAQFLPGFEGVDYIAFILPLSIISAALDSPAGQALVRDLESGYFDKLLLTPIKRSALVLGHILAGGITVVFISLVVLALAFLLGLRPAAGSAGILVLLAFTLLIGVGFGGLTVGVALRTGSSAATQGASFAFFPFVFLTSAFFPLDFLQGWLRIAATVNPVTYILDALRSLMISGFDLESLFFGILASLVISIGPFLFAVVSLRVRTCRQ
ncbi:MAG: ABC transporter permease [Ardenticatenaceae bacterium]|nr:ABC transporter permease [Ardenticatenaceae bacterium]